MKLDDHLELEKRIELLLADPAYQGHPLYEALSEIWELFRAKLARVERITKLSDAYQLMAQQGTLSMSERFEKEIRQLERIVRISDRYQEMMQEINAALVKAATHDPLTGLANRTLIIKRLVQETSRASRSGHPFVLAMLDVDYFKQFNDRHGHEVGDRILLSIAQAMRSSVREYDLCGRWGGDEFLMLFPETRLSEANSVMERLRHKVQDMELIVGSDALSISVSIGMTEYLPEESFSDTINRADLALLEAKRNGRNCCFSA